MRPTYSPRPFALPLLVALALVACGKAQAPAGPAATASATPAATPAPAPAPEKKDGGLFGFIGGSEPAPANAPDLGQFQVVSVALGTTLDADHAVRDARTTFAPRDTLHASVLSTGAHPGLTLVAHWTTADGTVVAHSEQAMVPTGPQVTTFTLKNADPWPPGMYQLAVQVGGQTLQSRAFEVVDPRAARGAPGP
jgi:hypothetical protein